MSRRRMRIVTEALPVPAAGRSRIAFLRGWIGACHPYPLSMVIALTALMSVASSDGSADALRFALVLLAMFCSQLAIGWSNDYLDRESDAAHQAWKPIASGLVTPRFVLISAILALAAALAIGAGLGAGPEALLAAGTACGIAYNLGLKSTPFSAVPFIVAFALLPPFVWRSLGVYRGDFVLLYVIASPLAVAAHLANLLPDLEADTASGRRNVAVSLGRSRTLAAIFVALLLPFVALDISLLWLHYNAELLAATLSAYVALIVAAGFVYSRARSRDGYARGFRLVALAAVVFAGGWLASV